jgi:nucleoside 2-deoxyribosyltransferase
MLRLIDKLDKNESYQIYIALRLFDIAEKIKAELLEKAVIDGVRLASNKENLSHRKVTFVPFRDSAQGEKADVINTQALYNNDIDHLNNSVMIVCYLDGLSKDEGVCFELGYALATGITSLLVSTDFIFQNTVDGQEFVFEPIIYLSASKVVRSTIIEGTETSFLKNILYTQEKILHQVTESVRELLLCAKPTTVLVSSVKTSETKLSVYLEFGGEQFEWQTRFADELSKIADKFDLLKIYRPSRYKGGATRKILETLVQDDLENIRNSDIVITCTDSEESPAGSAFIQGYARGLNKEIWLYNTKKTFIIGSNGYKSSRNLMLDYSADKTFTQFNQLLAMLENRAGLTMRR